MERKILKQYIMTIFDDGEIEYTPFNKKSESKAEKEINGKSIELRKVSSRIAQILTTLYYTIQYQKGKDDIYISENVTIAMKKTAYIFHVSQTSVLDKCTRQLSYNNEKLSSYSFKRYISEYITQKDETLKTILLDNVSKQSMQIDAMAINNFFENPETIQLLMNDANIEEL